MRRVCAWGCVSVAGGALALGGCRDVARFSSGGDHWEGTVVAGSFVRSGVAGGTRLCLLLDTDHLQDTPGSLSSSDGRFRATALRPVPQLAHDPLSTLDFGQGRVQNLLYMARPATTEGGGDVTVVLSLMESGGVEARLLRGAPGGGVPAAGADGGAEGADASLFAVFALERAGGPCPF